MDPFEADRIRRGAAWLARHEAMGHAHTFDTLANEFQCQCGEAFPGAPRRVLQGSMHFWRAVVEWVEHWLRHRRHHRHHPHPKRLRYVTARFTQGGPPCH